MLGFIFSVVVIYTAIAYLFGFTIFKWLLLAGIIIGFLALVWGIARHTDEYKEAHKWLEKKLKKIWRVIWD